MGTTDRYACGCEVNYHGGDSAAMACPIHGQHRIASPRPATAPTPLRQLFEDFHECARVKAHDPEAQAAYLYCASQIATLMEAAAPATAAPLEALITELRACIRELRPGPKPYQSWGHLSRALEICDDLAAALRAGASGERGEK